MASWCYVCSRKVDRSYKWIAGVKVHKNCMDKATKLFKIQYGRYPNIGEPK